MSDEAQIDDRGGKPSASSLDRVSHCPGSPAAERGLPELPKDEVTSDGTDIHDALHSGDDSELSVTPKQIARKLSEMEQRERDNWLSYYDFTPRETIRETRYWIRNPNTLEIICSAKPDVVYLAETRLGQAAERAGLVVPRVALVIDYKSGFAETTPSERNWQLRAQAVAIYQEHKVTHVRAAIAHSRLSSNFDSVDFDLDDLQRTEREILTLIWKSEQPDAPRVPGPHCRWCKANGLCTEKTVYDHISAAHLPLVPVKGKPDQLNILLAVDQLTPIQMAFLYERKSSMEFAYSAMEHRMKNLPEKVLESIGYRMAPGNNLRDIVDPATAFARLGPILTWKDEAGNPHDDRLLGLKLTIGKLAEALADRTNVSLQAAKEQIYEAISDAVREKQGNPRLRPL